MSQILKRPGGELATRPLHFFWAVDCSGSMYGEKIGSVNNAIQSVIPEMQSEAQNNPNARLLVRTLKFSSGASWVTATPVEIEKFAWDDLDANGVNIKIHTTLDRREALTGARYIINCVR